jgi:amphi-Trp domain-containing protein
VCDRTNCVTTAHPAGRDRASTMRTNRPKTVMTRPNRPAEFTHEEHLSRRQAAERLVDVAYALTAGATLELRAHGEYVNVPVADELVLERTSTTDGERVDVNIRLSWSGARTPDPRANRARRHS